MPVRWHLLLFISEKHGNNLQEALKEMKMS